VGVVDSGSEVYLGSPSMVVVKGGQEYGLIGVVKGDQTIRVVRVWER